MSKWLFQYLISINTWILITFWRYKSTERLHVNRNDDRRKTIVKRYSLVLLENLFMKKKKTQKRYIRGIKKYRVKKSRMNIIVTWRIILVFQRNVFSRTSVLADAHRTLLYPSQKNVKTYENIHDNHISISCHVFCSNLCVIYTYFS